MTKERNDIEQRHEDRVESILGVKEVEKFLIEQQDLLKGFVRKSEGEIAELGKMSEETKARMNECAEECSKLAKRLHDLEQKTFPAHAEGELVSKSLGELVTDSDGLKSMVEGRARSCRVRVDNLHRKAIINATGQNQPLVAADRQAGIVAEPDRQLRIRNLLPAGRTSSNAIEYPRENVFTNLAGPQVGGSPEAFENVTKPESNITFTLQTASVVTLAHFIPASTQVLEDSPMLESYINTRLMYGLKLYEDTNLLNGTGANGELPGLWTNRTAYTVPSPNSYTTKLDVLRNSITLAWQSNYAPTAFVLNPQDWADLELSKDSQGRYLFANPQNQADPRVWGLPVVVTNSMTADRFLCGAWPMAAMIFDRMDAAVAMSLEDDQNFRKNMVTIRAEERLALAIFRPAGIIGGTFATATA